nr:hypothetical protein [Candidatus Aminicenantes bacterium]
MKNDGPLGIQYLKVGQGDPDWDTHGAPAPNALLEGLENPDSNPIEAPNLEIVYLNDQDAEVPGPTPRLQITATLGIDIPSPPAGSGL